MGLKWGKWGRWRHLLKKVEIKKHFTKGLVKPVGCKKYVYADKYKTKFFPMLVIFWSSCKWGTVPLLPGREIEMFRDRRWPEGWSPSNKYPLLDGKTGLLSGTGAHRHTHAHTRTPPKHWEAEWCQFSQKAHSWINAFIPWTNSTRLWVIPVINNSKTRTIYFVCSKQPIKTSQFRNLSLDLERFFGWYIFWNKSSTYEIAY